MGAFQGFRGERFVGRRLAIVPHRSREIGTGDHEQYLAFLHVVAKASFQIDNAARTKRGDVDGFIHVGLDGSVGAQFGRQVAGLDLHGLEQLRVVDGQEVRVDRDFLFGGHALGIAGTGQRNRQQRQAQHQRGVRAASVRPQRSFDGFRTEEVFRLPGHGITSRPTARFNWLEADR